MDNRGVSEFLSMFQKTECDPLDRRVQHSKRAGFIFSQILPGFALGLPPFGLSEWDPKLKRL